MSELHLRSQIERLTIAETLLASVWEEVRLGCVQDGALQLAVNCQIDINRIVWKLNEQKLNEQPIIIKNAPTIDPLPVIRCRDCKFYTEEERWCRRLGLCGAFGPNDYCSHAEEREEC